MQASFAQMGTPLSEVVFVVVDLETTGGPPGADAITEIGAVRVRGGAVESEMSTLVNPGRAIPAQITVLTGITNAMVAGAPPVVSRSTTTKTTSLRGVPIWAKEACTPGPGGEGAGETTREG